MLGPFFVDDNTVDAATEVLHLHHNFGLVMLSIGMAFVSCCASMYMAHTNRETSALNHRRVSLLCASMVLGLGIWVMHFVGMLALQTPMPVTYDVTLTSLSILPGMVAASMALWSLQHDNPSNTRIFISGCLVGVGIATMHYSGLSAMQLDGLIFFDIAPFLASIVSGLGFAVLAFFLHRSIYARGLQSLRWIWRLAPPLCMTVAIASMHYLSMHALHIMVSNDRLIQTDHSHYAIDNAQTMSVLLVVVCLVVFSLLGLANALLRYRDLWQAVAARDARLNAMLDTSADGIITIDAQGIVTDYNPAAENIFGYSKEEVIGRNVSMLMPSPLAQQHDGHLHKHLGKPERPIAVNGREVLGKHKEGRHLPLQLSVGKANTTSGTVFIGYLQDISSRKRTDAQLRIAASVFQHVREGVAIVDANHNISDVNPAFLRLLELSREECIGKTLEMLYEDAGVTADMSKLWQIVATEQYWQSETLFSRKTGGVWMQRMSISPVLNELHRPHHFIAVISDVSERPGLEVLLSNAELYDSATNLPSQKLFLQQLSTSLLSAQRKASHLALALVQLRPTKTPATQPRGVNYVAALRFLSQVLHQQLRSTDTIARWDEDHIALLLPGIKDGDTLQMLQQRLGESLYQAQSHCAEFGVTSLHIGVSATLTHPYMSGELLEHARQSLTPVLPASPRHLHSD